MKSECEIRVMLANEEAKLKNYIRNNSLEIEKGVSSNDMYFHLKNHRIELMKEILETEDNQCY